MLALRVMVSSTMSATLSAITSGILKVAGAVAGGGSHPLTGGASAALVGAAVGLDVFGGAVGHDSASGIAGSAVLDLATADRGCGRGC